MRLNIQLPIGKMLKQHRAQKRIVRRTYGGYRQGPQPRNEVRQLHIPATRRHSRRRQHAKPALPSKVQQMKQGLFIEGGAVQIFENDTLLKVKTRDSQLAQLQYIHNPGARLVSPDIGKMALAASARTLDQVDMMGPIGPRIDEIDGSRIARTH